MNKTIQHISLVVIVITFFVLKATAQQEENVFIFEGKVVNSKKMEGLYNAHIINTTKNIGTVSFFDGTFRIHASVGDSLKISLIGYENKKFKIKSAHSKRLTPLIIPLKFKPIDMQSITVYGKTYEQFKRDFVQLDIEPVSVNEAARKSIDSELDAMGPASATGFKGPIQMLYDRFNEKERLRRKLIKNRRKYGDPEDYKNFPVYPSNIDRDTIPTDSP